MRPRWADEISFIEVAIALAIVAILLAAIVGGIPHDYEITLANGNVEQCHGTVWTMYGSTTIRCKDGRTFVSPVSYRRIK